MYRDSLSSRQQRAPFPRPRVVLVGCGGAGCNALHRLGALAQRGFELLAVSPNPKHLAGAWATRSIHAPVPDGGCDFSARGDPSLGVAAVLEAKDQVAKSLQGASVVFVVAGLGGGMGTGGALEIARISRAVGALTIGVVYLPFQCEGPLRQRTALQGLSALRDACDQVLVLSNEDLLSLTGGMPLHLAFRTLDELAARGMRTFTTPLLHPEEVDIGLDEIRQVLHGGGLASVGYGESRGEDSSLALATRAALSHRYVSDVSPGEVGGALMWGATDRTRGSDETGDSEALLRRRFPHPARTVIGWTVDPTLAESPKSTATVVVTGMMHATHPCVNGSLQHSR